MNANELVTELRYRVDRSGMRDYLSKLRNGESGERYAYERLAEHDAPRQWAGETGAAYLKRLQAEGWLRPLRHPGNFVFTFGRERTP